MTFRLKLLLSMVLLVVAVTGAVLFVTQQKLQEAQRQKFQSQFATQAASFSALQATRLAAAKEQVQTLVRSPRFRASLEEDDVEIIYQVAGDELRNVLASTPGEAATAPDQTAISSTARATFFRMVNAQGRVLPPPPGRGGLDAWAEQGRRLDQQLSQLNQALATAPAQQLGYLAPELAVGGRRLHEVIVTKVTAADTDDALGAVVIGFPVPLSLAPRAPRAREIHNAIWLEGRVYSATLAERARHDLAKEVAAVVRASPSRAGEFDFALDTGPHRAFCRPLETGAHFPPASQISLFSLADAHQQERDLRRKVLSIGGAALAATLLLSFVLSGKLSAQIKALKAGTTEIGKGNYQVKVPVLSTDETGSLAVSFNEMAEGLALKEKYRSVLNVVADARVAQRLIDGGVALGGETREISVLFCDIRGFTALTQNMDPGEVIRMLNEHFEPLTRVVNEHHGVVDKFVGDLIMAVFGAPESHGNDAAQAVNCARAMMRHRNRLNETAHPTIRMGIGIASGPAVAGCMGSSDRLNYTVLGERVNLASRLCGQAGPMEIVMDQTTRERLGDGISVEPLPELKLKGFSSPVRAYKVLGHEAAAFLVVAETGASRAK
ncbi:MAG: HAMP domain-containing protein [Verrucomicrobia bacterium]|nr:HAMP domain-containing protein [Verrucomicrobiota bacterium]